MILYPIIDLLKRIVVALPDYAGGGGGSYDGIEIVGYYDTGEIKEVNWHGDTCPKGMQYFWYNAKPVIVNVIDATTIDTNFFYNAYANPTMSYLEKVTCIGGFGLVGITSATNDLSGVTLSLPNLETPSDGFSSVESRFRNNSVYYYGGYYFPKNQRIAKYDFYQNKVANATWQIGSVGYPVLEVGTTPFGGTSGSGTITIYTTGELLDTIKNAVQNGAGANYTWIYKAAEATTYNGTSYAAGDTILTV